MELHKVRESFHKVLKERDLTIQAFAEKHQIPESWLYKFGQGKMPNPRYRRLRHLQNAIASEAVHG
jgi:predicted transcriptional regulator